MITRQVANHERRQQENDCENIDESALNIPYREAVGS